MASKIFARLYHTGIFVSNVGGGDGRGENQIFSKIFAHCTMGKGLDGDLCRKNLAALDFFGKDFSPHICLEAIMYEQFDRELNQLVQENAVVPKPKSENLFRILRVGKRRGEPAIIYSIPNHKNESQPHEKGITYSEFHIALSHLQNTGKITREWFNQNLQGCANEGACNFTTLGGILELLNYAKYSGVSTYSKR